jgi:acyl carrier protein
MPSDALLTEIKELIVQELDLRSRTAQDIDSDAPLFGAGLGLDSLDALQLAMAIEEHFGVTIPEGEPAKAIFASVSAIAGHIEAVKSAGA